MKSLRLLVAVIPVLVAEVALPVDFDTVWTQEVGLATPNMVRGVSSILMEIDPDSNLIIVSMTGSDSTMLDILVTKRSLSGELLWSTTCDDSAILSDGDQLSAIAVDGFGNIFVAGVSEDSAWEWRTLLLKLSPAGELLWVRTMDFPDSYYDLPSDLACDQFGNVIVSGTTDHETFLLKYDVDGAILWDRRFVSASGYPPGDRTRIEVNSAGDIFILGKTFLGKVGPAGDTSWVTYEEDWLVAGQLLLLGQHLYATGSVYVEESFDLQFVIAKYDTSGYAHWERRYHDSSANPAIDGAACESRGLAIDSKGNPCVTVEEARAPTFQVALKTIATIKYDSTGDVVWLSRFAVPDAAATWPSDLQLGLDDRVYVTGGVDFDEVLTIVYDPFGAMLTAERIGGAIDWYNRSIRIADEYSFFVTTPTISGQGWGTALLKFQACCPCLADPSCNEAGSTVLDVVTTINVAFRGSPVLTTSLCNFADTDFNCNNSTDVVDVVKVIDVAFRGQDPQNTYCSSPCAD